MSKQKQKEPLSLMIVKTVLAIAVFTGLGTIIIGGGVVIMKYYNSEVNNRMVEQVDQETKNYYDVLEKRCAGDGCCLSFLKIMRENNYKEAGKDYKCPDGFKLGGLMCETSLKWCEPIEGCVDDQNNRREIGEIWLESPTMFMECNEFGSVASNYILSCGNEKLIISNSLSFDENSIYRDMPSSPFSIGTDGSLKYTWIIDGNKYTESSGGPTGVFASCEDEKATIFHFGGMGESYYSKTFFDNNYKIRIGCLDSYLEEGIYGEGLYNEDDPKNFTISKVKDGERIGELKLLENGKEICQEIKGRYQELKETVADTSNWQTYRNEEFGFEVKYPEEWKFYSNSNQFIAIASYNLYDSQQRIINNDGVVIEIKIKTLNKLTLFESLKNEDNYYFDGLSKISLNGYDAYKLSVYYTDFYFLNNKNEKIRIDIIVRNSHSNKNANFIGDQILSSFKFIEK